MFSERNNYKSDKVYEITVREDAPEELRRYLPMAFQKAGLSINEIRNIVCEVLQVGPNPDNWSDGNIMNEILENLTNADWFEVYDTIEAFSKYLSRRNTEQFEKDINTFFKKNGIGWQLIDNHIEYRGEEGFEEIVHAAEASLAEAGMKTANKELKEAISDLSRRPDPDITGAIQHSLAALECVTREVTGDEKATLGELMKRYGGVLPRPLDQAIEKIWGYSSEYGRHLKEGKNPDYDEAELVVSLAAAVSQYLIKKHKGA